MRDAMRQRLLDQVIRLVQKQQPPEQKIVLVLDERATRVVSAAMQLFDLAEEGVALVEPLGKLRRPFPTLPAIYLVEPTQANVERIVADFAVRKEPTYRVAHVFFTRKASDDVIALLRGLAEPKAGKKKKPKTFVPRLASMYEANVDFLAVEEHVFHLDLPQALVQLFGPDEERAQHCQSRIVDGVASLCATLHEYPWIRFVEGNALGETLARNLQARQDALFRDDKDFTFFGADDKSGGGMARATVLFLDRRQDLAAPLLHEFTYQALVFDVLESREKVVKYGDEGKERATLSEQDSVWVQFRHLHVSTVIERLTAQVREFKNTTAGRFQEEGDKMTVEEMREVVKDIPLYNEVMAAHAKHLALCQACMDKIRKRDLYNLAGLEQTVVTGAEPDGVPASEAKVLNELAMLMRRTELDPRDKLRLACLHAVTLGSVNQDVVSKFIRDSNMAPEAQSALLGLCKLGLSIVVSNSVIPTASTSSTMSAWLRAATGKSREAVETAYRNPDAVARNCAIAKATKIKVSRFTPLMYLAAETLCNSRLDAEAFPFVMQPPPGSGFGGMPFEALQPGARVVRQVTHTNRSLSVRTHTAVTQVASDGKSLESALKGSDPAERVGLNGARVIVFIAGGVTYSEMRAITELARTCKREVIVGSTHIIKPDAFVDDVAVLADEEQARQYLERDPMAEAHEFYAEQAPAAAESGGDPMPNDVAERIDSEDELAQKVNDGLWWTSWIFSKIPGGRRLQRYLDGEDSDSDDDDDDAGGEKRSSSSAACGCASRPSIVQKPQAASAGESNGGVAV